MAAPVITSLVTDKPSYNTGDLITATVGYTPGTSPANATTTTLAGTATDQATGQTGQLEVTFTVGGGERDDLTTLTLADTGGRAWTPVSDSGTVAVFTATA